MPCNCNNKNKKVKYVEYNIPNFPVGKRFANKEERLKAPPGTRYPTIQEIKKNPLLLLRK